MRALPENFHIPERFGAILSPQILISEPKSAQTCPQFSHSLPSNFQHQYGLPTVPLVWFSFYSTISYRHHMRPEPVTVLTLHDNTGRLLSTPPVNQSGYPPEENSLGS